MSVASTRYTRPLGRWPSAATPCSRPPSRRCAGSACARGGSARSPPPPSCCSTTSTAAPYDQQAGQLVTGNGSVPPFHICKSVPTATHPLRVVREPAVVLAALDLTSGHRDHAAAVAARPRLPRLHIPLPRRVAGPASGEGVPRCSAPRIRREITPPGVAAGTGALRSLLGAEIGVRSPRPEVAGVAIAVG